MSRRGQYVTFAKVTTERSARSFHGVELGLYQLWGALLARDDISLTDNFFEVGGTAAQAEELCRQIRQTFGCEISMPELREAPSIGALSLVIRTNRSGQPDDALVQLQGGKPLHRASIYCFHPISGSIGRFITLFDFLDRDQPVFGLQSVGLAGRDRPDRRVDVMADRYSRAIRAQHDGPGALLIGYSFGGLLAVETARHLSGLIAGLAIAVVDCSPTEKEPVDYTYGYKSLVHSVLQLDADLNSLMILDKPERLEKIRAIASAQGRLPANFSLERLERMVDVCHSNQEAANAYEPAPGGGSLTVFESDDGRSLGCGRQWERYFDKVTIRSLPGDHDSIMEGENIAAIALWVQREAWRLANDSEPAEE